MMKTTLLKSALQSTVAVIAHTPNGAVVLGSGVTIAKDTVLTCSHVVAPAPKEWQFEVGPDHQYDSHRDFLPGFICKSFAIDRTRDLLLLKTSGLPSVPAQIRAAPFEQGEDVFWVGHPGPDRLQAAPLVSAGIVSGHALVRPFLGGPTKAVPGFRFDGTVLAGNSGGGVFDQRGEIVGLVCASPLFLRHPELDAFLKNDADSSDVAKALRTLVAELRPMTLSGVGFAISAAELTGGLPDLLTNLSAIP